MKTLIIAMLLIAATTYPALALSPNEGMQTGSAGLELIRSYEGLRLKAYRCPAGVLTIGYGHTGGVRVGQEITKELAVHYLMKDCGRFEKHISTKVTKRALKQNQFDACVSLCYNAGYQIKGELQKSLNANNTDGVKKGFRKIVHAKGKKLNGLVRRREAEIQLYIKE